MMANQQAPISHLGMSEKSMSILLQRVTTFEGRRREGAAERGLKHEMERWDVAAHSSRSLAPTQIAVPICKSLRAWHQSCHWPATSGIPAQRLVCHLCPEMHSVFATYRPQEAWHGLEEDRLLRSTLCSFKPLCRRHNPSNPSTQNTPRHKCSTSLAWQTFEPRGPSGWMGPKVVHIQMLCLNCQCDSEFV